MPGELSVAAAGGDAFFRVNDRKLEALLQATERDMQKAEYAVLRQTNDQYRQIIFNAQTYANTGAGTVQQAVDMAVKDFLAAGINCIEYKNGARHTIADYADMYIRTAERRAYLTGEGQKRQEWGVSLVIVNKRGGHPCPQCAKWCGKILIDDVYSGGKPDGKHTLLSEAMAQGFLHPRCKDGVTTYFPGVTSVPDPVTREELQEAAQAEERENREAYARRQAEKYERMEKYSLDPENKRKYAARAEEWERESTTVGNVVSFSRDFGRTEAVRLKEYSENNLYVSKKISLSRDEIQELNRRITDAKKKMGITDSCKIPCVVVSDGEFSVEGAIASFHPTENALFISKSLLAEDRWRDMQSSCACPDNPISTLVHELFHWKDAEEYKAKLGHDSFDVGKYNTAQREKARAALIEEGVDIFSLWGLNMISPYAYKSGIDNDWEEVYTEYRTMLLLRGETI